MKKIILLLMIIISSNIYSQTPPIKTRSNGLFTELDKYLNVSLRLGIPTNSSDGLGLDNTSSYKMMYNTTLNTLRIYNGTTWSNAVPSTTQETFLNSYWLTKLSPANSILTGFHITNNTNTLTGFTSYNTNDTDNSATSSFVAKGSGADYTNSIAMSHFGGNYFVNILRNNSAIYSDTQMFFMNYGNKDIDFHTGSAYGSTTSKFKILANGQLSIGVVPTTDNTLTSLLGRDSSGNIKSFTLSSIPILGMDPIVNIGRNATGGLYFGRNTSFSGGNGTRIGEYAGYLSTSNTSVFIGSSSGESSTGTLNTYIGPYSGHSSIGDLNVYVGTNAGVSLPGYTNNTLIGANSGTSNTGTDLTNLTFLGANSGRYNTFNNVIHISSGYLPYTNPITASNQLVFNTLTRNLRFDLNLLQDLNLTFTDKSGQLPIIGTTAPASATATGVTGEIRITATYVYFCIATNTWVRAALATW